MSIRDSNTNSPQSGPGLLVTIISGLTALASALGALLAAIPRVSSSNTGYLPLLMIITVVAITIFATRLAAFLRPVSKPQNTEGIVGNIQQAKDLIGRSKELAEIPVAVKSFKLIIWSGESGVGKSAFIKHGFYSALSSQKRNWIVVSSYRTNWDLGLAQSIRDAASDSFPEMNLPLDSGLLDLFTFLKDSNGQKPMVILEEFDDYVLSNTDLLRNVGGSRKTPQEVILSNSTWGVLQTALASNKVQILISIRSENVGWANCFQVVASGSYTLPRIQIGDVRSFLRQLTESGFARDPDNGWLSLCDLMEIDLNREGGVLPAEMNLALKGTAILRCLTRAEYQRIGGLPGLEAAYISDRVKRASNETQIKQEHILDILSWLSSGTETPIRPQSIQELLKRLADEQNVSYEIDSIERLMTLLEDDGLVRDEVHSFDSKEGSRATETRYTIFHKHLNAAIAASNLTISLGGSTPSGPGRTICKIFSFRKILFPFDSR